MTTIPTKCNCCNEMVYSFSDRSDWFGKYLKPGEDKICHVCITDRAGYAEEFMEKIGVSVEALDSNEPVTFSYKWHHNI